MPKRSREDSSSPSTTSSLSPTPDPSSPAPTDVPVHLSKYIQTSDEPPTRAVMKCSLPPHHDTISFPTFEDFELHYAKEHAHRCSECRKNFPTEYFLGLHIGENHDPLAEVKRAKEEKTVSLGKFILLKRRRADSGQQYRCFVEDCDKLCSTPQKRRMHVRTFELISPFQYRALIARYAPGAGISFCARYMSADSKFWLPEGILIRSSLIAHRQAYVPKSKYKRRSSP